MKTTLHDLLAHYRRTAVSEREKGTYFERLVKTYLTNEPYYADLYGDRVWLWEEWRAEAVRRGLRDVGGDAGIDLVAQTAEGDLHAIQAKFYDEDARLVLGDLATFLTAAGRKEYAHSLLFLTATHSTEHLRHALQDQKTPVSLVTLHDLEASRIDWSHYQPDAPAILKPKKVLRAHQESALKAVVAGLKEADRGKMIMACGTGKTFATLKIAETMVGPGKRALFLVPSLALLSQSLTEWTQESATPLHSFAVCSDSGVGKKQDDFEMLTHELQYPATTDALRLATEMRKRHDAHHMSVVFATYHSIDVLHQAQHEHGLEAFDLVVCDEAHRTTGATFDGEDESAFVAVHDADYLRAAKRLYMTATPRIYGDVATVQAEEGRVALYSMDNPAWFGKQLFVITFSEAVKRGLLVDYKVIVLAVEEAHINRRLQDLLKDENNQLRVDDAAKIVGCWKALAKLGITEDGSETPDPMQRAVAFCQVIEPTAGKKHHRVSSKEIAGMFQAVVETYQDAEDIEAGARLTCEASHVDGSMNAGEKDAKLAWLKAQIPEGTCRILSNVRCLSEGVDVPALDAVLFLTPRNSQVDVVQSVGRVMRIAPGKKRGYVVLPVVIPAGVEPHAALNDNTTYRVVWQVLQALRSHDDRFDAMINKMELVGPDRTKMEIVAVTDTLQRRSTPAKSPAGQARGQQNIGKPAPHPESVPEQQTFAYEVGEIERALYAKVVEKVGNRHHWEDWANDIAKIARTHIDRINAILESPENKKECKAFNAFAAELRDDLNDKITDAEIVETLAQHLITKPVFEALFEGHEFTKNNPVSKAMEKILALLQEHHLDKEATTLAAFYDSVKLRAEGITSAEGQQKIIKELYDKFFNGAFPQLSKRLGIVYTPIEVVDFIIHSVQHILETEFNASLGDKDVHILDPFTGTGTFVTRLIQSGLITPERLSYKYRNELHANEIVLLAYYIASINIERAYHDIAGGNYVPFEGICLTDTFQMFEKDDLVDALLVDNSRRRRRQKKLDIRVIVGNPPYSVGQGNANNNNPNVEYPTLDERIRSTYAARSTATLKNALYDSYIRAIRWASDRIGDAGVIGFVTNAGWLEANTADGLRQCLAEEFSSLYVFHLRGNARTSGEARRKEKDNVFGMGSRAPIAISILIKNPQAAARGQIHFHDIGDYLSREEKLEKIAGYASVAGIADWQAITPNVHGDWLNQRDDSFGEFMVLGNKDDRSAPALFDNYSGGVKTNRDAWVYNASRSSVTDNMTRMIDVYNAEVARFNATHHDGDTMARTAKVDGFINTDPERISWTRSLKQELAKDRQFTFRPDDLVPSLYRPFTKQWLYFNRTFNEMVLQMPRIFPDGKTTNLAMCASGVGARNFSILLTNVAPCFDNIEKGQCFPLYLYDEVAHEEDVGSLLPASPNDTPRRRDAITDEGLAHFQSAYPDEPISKEDLFYYVYGILHSPDYRERYADNLSKELPRIPRVKSSADFWAFSRAGRALGKLHIGYESVKKYPLTILSKGNLTKADYRVEKMRFAKKKDPETGKNVDDRSTVIYNGKITLTGIPEAAWDYVVNGKPALDWVMERQSVRTHKESGIVNDANDWAIETIGDPRYPLELFQRVVTVSLETQAIVAGLPGLKVLES